MDHSRCSSSLKLLSVLQIYNACEEITLLTESVPIPNNLKATLVNQPYNGSPGKGTGQNLKNDQRRVRSVSQRREKSLPGALCGAMADARNRCLPTAAGRNSKITLGRTVHLIVDKLKHTQTQTGTRAVKGQSLYVTSRKLNEYIVCQCVIAINCGLVSTSNTTP